jgi:hypothetical protein
MLVPIEVYLEWTSTLLCGTPRFAWLWRERFAGGSIGTVACDS